MPTIVINPGSGPVADATEENAIKNIEIFIKDCKVKGIIWHRLPENDEKGRFCFKLIGNEREHIVDMPGLPIEQVRYIDNKTQNIWHFPRLYVDGSSWVWKYAILDSINDWTKAD